MDTPITELLREWAYGNEQALDKLIPLVYTELRALATRQMRLERKGHTLQTTALVNEAFCKLVDQKNVDWQSRTHFFAIAARLMRRVLIDHARSRWSKKRGGAMEKVTLESDALLTSQRAIELIELDDALKKLAVLDEQKSRIVEMKFFAGLTNEEIAAVEQISSRTVEREWRKARAWLFKAIQYN
jgi:RNA polymerase sigma factor (TIGR02999 family)